MFTACRAPCPPQFLYRAVGVPRSGLAGVKNKKEIHSMVRLPTLSLTGYMDTPHSMKFKASHLKSCWILRTCPFYQYICNVTFKILIMGKLTLEQIQQIQKNLKVGKCPNCGYEGNKDVMPQEMQLVSFNINSKRIVDFEK